jgi:hypothetical protein
MASTITTISSLIDATFPVPGQDNDTQGFRTNFRNIQDSFLIASNDITDLQIEQIAIVNALGNFTDPTTFRGTEVTATVITSETINNSGDITSNRFIGDGSLLSNLNVANVRNIGSLTNLTTENLTVGLVNGFTATIFVPSAPASSVGVVTDKQGMIHANSSYVYVCYRDYVNGSTNIWARVATTGATW